MTNFYLTNFTKNTILTAIIILPSLLSSQHSRGSAIDFEFKQSISDSGIDTLLTTPTRINNLAVLGKIWGFLKYYHPAVARGEYNWDNELFRILPRMLEVESPAERDQALIGWIDALGEVVPGKNNIKKKGNIKLLPDLGWIDSSGFSPALVSRLTRIRNVVREGEHYYVELMRGVGGARFKNEDPYSGIKYPDAGYRLLSLYRYWNYIAYYFPYKYLMDDNWNDILKEYIPIFSTASSELEYKLAVLSLIARIDDSHASIRNKGKVLENYWGIRWSPLELSFTENKFVVAGYFDDTLGKKTGLQPGDVIERINGKKTEEIIKKRLPFTPGSNYIARMRNLALHLLRTNDSILKIDYSRGEANHRANLPTYLSDVVFDNYSSYPRDTCFKILRPEIAYLHGGTLMPAYLPAIMKTALSQSGLIIDMRTYPRSHYLYDLCQYLLARPRDFFKSSFASLDFPGMFTMTEEIKTFGKYKRPGYSGKVIILVNEFTQSEAEFNTMAFQCIPGAIVIGSQTAGADGNITPFYLPGGIETAFSSVGIYYPDGTETQRTGIVPDIVVKPTIEGIREGRDEVLERALQLLSEGS